MFHQKNSLLRRYKGSLLTLAVADALGMATERLMERSSDQITDFQAGFLPAGCYTDDTEQARILAESLIRDSGLDLEKYALHIKQETRFKKGFGPSLRKFFFGNTDGHFVPSNGVGMKIAPLALFYRRQPNLLNDVVEAAAQITHRHPASVAGAIAIAHAVHYALTHNYMTFDRDECLERVVSQTGIYDEPLARKLATHDLRDNGGCSVYSTIPLAIHTFLDAPTELERGIIFLANSGGDTDTKAAMFGAVSGAFNGIDAIPRRWYAGLENGPKGRDYLLELAGKLYAKSN
ncbi:TPA: ADP-ribosylglycohydrolase family protein [Candidatus Woesearchaeota archaeon]|nr:ADP-ribosylglycohydrolase family protein [Candidatus Woesearchaeota archaeon]